MGDIADLRINSSSEALSVYQKYMGLDYYIGKESVDISEQDQKILPPNNGCYVGFFPGWGELEDSVNVQQIIDFEAMSNKSVAFSPVSIFWGENYSNSQNLDKLASCGVILLLRLMPWGEPYWEPYGYQENYSLQRIIDGEFD